MTFPPQSQHEDDIERMLEVLATVVDTREALYVSSPFTTGRLRSEWHRGRDAPDEADPGYLNELRRHVLEPNRASARQFVKQLRRKTGSTVVDPLSLEDVPGWGQDDYRVFWGRVIERFAKTVVFRQGWEYSSGCSFEFITAVRCGAELLDQDLRPITAAHGRDRLQSAIRENQSTGHATSFLESVLAALASLSVDQVDSQESNERAGMP
jgi:hypothetical protein